MIDPTNPLQEPTSVHELRDWFAGLAMQAWIRAFIQHDVDVVEAASEDIAETAYCIADAMLKERGDKR